MTVTFECTTVIAAPPDAVFDLSLSVDAHLESMERSGERATGGVTTGSIGLGEEVTWRAVHFGIPFRMTSRVTELERPTRFVDEQVRGPFGRFRHEHLFSAGVDGTVMTDRIAFSAPLGPLGWAAEKVLLGRYLQELIEERNTFLKRAAEQAAAADAGPEPGYDTEA